MTHEQGRGLPPSCGGRGRPAAAAGHSWSLPTASHPSSLRVCAWRSPPRGGAVRLRGRPAWRSEWSPCRQHWGGWVTGSLESPAQILPTPCPSSLSLEVVFWISAFVKPGVLLLVRMGDPFQGPRAGSCLTLRSDRSRETRAHKGRDFTGRGARVEDSR